jgi:glycosyltransferase involved in cell wall biosynthesis
VPSSFKIAIVYGVPAGAGGLGQQAASVLTALAGDAEVHAFGPGRADIWPLPTEVPAVQWHAIGPKIAHWRKRYTPLRFNAGRLQLLSDRAIGQTAAEQVSKLKPDLCYVFTQVGLETLEWARAAKVPAIVESPNGHIRNFRRVYESETQKWGGGPMLKHPAPDMVERVAREYELADAIRVSSRWSRDSLSGYGVAAEKITIFQQPLNLSRFAPAAETEPVRGPLRICFVGSLDLRKGFVYLLRALKLLGPGRARLEFVGATGDRLSKQILRRERAGLDVQVMPGDPAPAYRRAELMALPTLEDGSPFAVAEAMACGLPVIVTEACGSAEWVRHGESGWIVPAGDAEALAAALEEAMARRAGLREMGRLARRDTESRAGLHCLAPLREWILSARSAARNCRLAG